MRSASVILGGVIGTSARWAVGLVLPFRPPSFPWATLAVNVSGAFGLGLAATLLVERLAGTARLRPFLAVGVFGSYTTFSTMATDGVILIDHGRPGSAVAYWMASFALGQLAGLAGVRLGSLGTV